MPAATVAAGKVAGPLVCAGAASPDGPAAAAKSVRLAVVASPPCAPEPSPPLPESVKPSSRGSVTRSSAAWGACCCACCPACCACSPSCSPLAAAPPSCPLSSAAFPVPTPPLAAGSVPAPEGGAEYPSQGAGWPLSGCAKSSGPAWRHRRSRIAACASSTCGPLIVTVTVPHTRRRSRLSS